MKHKEEAKKKDKKKPKTLEESKEMMAKDLEGMKKKKKLSDRMKSHTSPF